MKWKIEYQWKYEAIIVDKQTYLVHIQIHARCNLCDYWEFYHSVGFPKHRLNKNHECCETHIWEFEINWFEHFIFHQILSKLQHRHQTRKKDYDHFQKFDTKILNKIKKIALLSNEQTSTLVWKMIHYRGVGTCLIGCAITKWRSNLPFPNLRLKYWVRKCTPLRTRFHHPCLYHWLL